MSVIYSGYFRQASTILDTFHIYFTVSIMHHMINITDLVPAGVITEQQMRFVTEYVIDLNATKAAIRAGYSEHTAAEQAYRLLRNIHISRAMKSYRGQIADDCGITAGDIIRKQVEIADRCMTAVPVMKWNGEEMVETGEWQFDSKGAIAAWTLVSKMLGFIDNKAADTGAVTGLNIMFISHMAQVEAGKQGITIEQLKKQVSQTVTQETNVNP